MASLLYPDEDQSQWPTSLLPVDDGTPPVLQADPRADALGQTYRAITEAIERQGGQAFRYANNPIGTETTRPEQTVSMPDPSFRPGVMLPGGTAPVSRETIDAFRAGSEDLYNQASLLGGSRGVFEPPGGGGGGAITLASRRPLANPPPSTRGLLDVPAPAPEPPPTPPPGFTAYHGSPHSFDAFDLSKIGTGEGAQAYGHGMYLADAEPTATMYRENLSNPALFVDGKKVGEIGALGTDPVANAAHALATTPTPYAAREYIQQSMDRAADGNFGLGQSAGKAVLKAIDDMAGSNVEIRPGGHMYEVQVNADPAHFLDWDKPLNQQHPTVQAALKPFGLDPATPGPRILTAIHHTQFDENGRLIGELSSPEDLLQQAGIPGIRYLDRGSRGAGDGTRNTVVFDPATMEIIRKYGLAGLMAGGGAAALSGQQGQQQQ